MAYNYSDLFISPQGTCVSIIIKVVWLVI